VKTNLLALAAGLLFCAGSANATSWGIVGDFNTWDNDVEMTETEDGNFTVTMESLSGAFKFRADKNWNENFGGEVNRIIDGNGTVPAVRDGYNFDTGGEVLNNVTLVLNPESQTLTISGLDKDLSPYTPPTEGSLYMRGTMNDWGATPEYMFNNNGNNTFSLHLKTLPAGEFKLADEAWGEFNFGGDYTITESGTFILTPAGTNIKVAEDLTNVDLFFNLTDLSLAVTVHGPVALYLRGGINNWGVDPEYKFATDDNITFTLHLDTMGTGEFKLGDESWGTYNYGGDFYITGDTTCQLVDNGNNLYLAEELTDVNLTFDINTALLTIKSKNTGVSAIEAASEEAVYFNLQGVRVENPENGIFIRVANGKTQKVAL
jgi:hypothetical protein